MDQSIKDKLQRFPGSNRKPALALLELIKDLAGSSSEGQADLKAAEVEFKNFFSASDLQNSLQALEEENLVKKTGAGYIPAPSADPASLDQALSDLAGTQKIPLLPGCAVRDIWSGFKDYLMQSEPDLSIADEPEQETGRLSLALDYRNKRHFFKAKYFPFPLPPPEGTLGLFFGSWLEEDFTRLSTLAAEKPWLKQAAFYNLATGSKINIVPGSIFAYFDWYLRENFNLRIAPCRVFAHELMNRGRLRFEG